MDSELSFLLDTSQPFNDAKVQILDKLSVMMSSSNSKEVDIPLIQVMMANEAFYRFKSNEAFCGFIDIILANSRQLQTKMISLIMLDEAIQVFDFSLLQKQWLRFPDDQRNNIKNFMMTMVLNLSGLEKKNKEQEILLSKGNKILVEILKYEWNTTWTSFIPDICSSSLRGPEICENNLSLLKLLSEEIFDFSKGQMTSSQIRELKDQMMKEFKTIYDLCIYIFQNFMANPENIKLTVIKSCLETLNAFLAWIPIAYIFSPELLDNVLVPLVQHNSLKIFALKCLNEIVSIPLKGLSASDQELAVIKKSLISMYVGFISNISSTFPCDYNLANERLKLMSNSSKDIPYFDSLCQEIVLFFISFFNTHMDWIEPFIDLANNENLIDVTRKGLQYIVIITELPVDQIFRICVEYWVGFMKRVIHGNKVTSQTQNALFFMESSDQAKLHKNVYPIVINSLREIVISRMAKPSEVLIVIDENGIPQKEVLANTENLEMYEFLKEILSNLHVYHSEGLKDALVKKLEKQMDGTEWSFDNLNSICWAIGSISGLAPEAEEKNFLIFTIRILLNLCEQKKGKENKAVVASNIMYVVGQYPQFLNSNWNFLKTVIRKLFEFMHEAYAGVKEMACNTFVKICESCKNEFVILQKTTNGGIEPEPYINTMIRIAPEESKDLSETNILLFYEALGHCVSAEPDIGNKAKQLEGILSRYNSVWRQIINEGGMNPEILMQENVISSLLYYLKILERLSATVGYEFYLYLESINNELSQLFNFYSSHISVEVANKGVSVLNFTLIKRLRGIKANILKIFINFLGFVGPNSQAYVQSTYGNQLLEILKGYSVSTPESREAEVINVFRVCVERLDFSAETLQTILSMLLEATLPMITFDFNSYPDHRHNFFRFLKSCIEFKLQGLFAIPADSFKTIMDCVLWACKHDLPTLYELGFDLLLCILKEISKFPDIANQFYTVYFCQILEDILFVMTDTFHKGGLKLEIAILGTLINSVMNGLISSSLNSSGVNNQQFLQEFISNLLTTNLPNTSKVTNSNFSNALLSNCNNPHNFKVIISDYLVKLTHFTPEEIQTNLE